MKTRWPRRRMAAILLLALAPAAAAAELLNLPPAAEWLPKDALLVLEIDRPADILQLASDLNLFEVLAASPEINNAARMFEPLGGKALLENLTAGGVAFAVYSGDKTILLADAGSAASLQAVQKLAQTIAFLQKNAPKTAGKAFYREHSGGASWTFDGKQFFATLGNRLAVSNHPEVVKALFQPRPADFVPLASWPLYAEARQPVQGAAARLFLNMAVLNQQPAFHKALGGDGSAIDLLLFGGLRDALKTARWASAGLGVQPRGLQVRAFTDGRPSAAMAFSSPSTPGQGLPPRLQVPGQLLSATLWRDLALFFSARDEIFPERSSGGILFENFMEIFFSGRDLKNEVFARFHPAVRLVAAAQRYDPAQGIPEEQYPAAGLVFRVEEAEEFGEIFEEAWQKAIGITNFTRGQQALPGLILDKATHAGVTYTYGYFSARGEKDRSRLPARFNLRPALVRTGKYFILTTTDQLACDLIDALRREDGRMAPDASGAHTVVEAGSGADIAAVLEANRASMIRQSVLGGGKKPEQATFEFDRNLALLRRIQGAKLSFRSTGGPQAELELRFK